jgi:hypothetical protein
MCAIKTRHPRRVQLTSASRASYLRFAKEPPPLNMDAPPTPTLFRDLAIINTTLFYRQYILGMVFLHAAPQIGCRC